MRNHSLCGKFGALLQRCKKLELRLRRAGLPAFMACLPLTFLALEYTWMLRQKNASLSRISGRILNWQATVQELTAHEKTRGEFIDLDRRMRGDIEAACDSMWALRDLSLAICDMFGEVGYHSPMLRRARDRFDATVKQACRQSQTLMDAVDAHDRRALAIRQQEQAMAQAHAASAAAHAARAAAGT